MHPRLLISEEEIRAKVDELACRISEDYLGFEIPDAWVVDNGLDGDEKFRTSP